VIIYAEKQGRIKEVFLCSVALLTLVFMSLAPVSQLGFLCASVFLFFIAFNLLEAMLPSLVSKLSPAGTKGTALGVYSTFQFSGAFVGGVAGGYLLEHFGHSVLFYACAGLCLLWCAVALFMKKPKQLSHLSMSVSDGVLGIDLNEHEGVEEAIYVKEDGLIYIKLDKRKIGVAELRSLMQPYLVEAK